MTNWRDIDCSTPDGLRQLDILTAQRLGYKVDRAPGGELAVVKPTGEFAYVAAFGFESTLWEDAWQWNEIPRDTTDLNAAAGLPLPDGWQLRVVVMWQPATIVCWYEDQRDDYKEVHALNDLEAGHTSEALARTLAWHAMMDEKERVK